jgi:hypothetical protein
LVALIDRTNAVLDGGVPDIPGAPGYVIAHIRRQLTDWRLGIESKWPELGPATPLAVPWKQAHPLLRKGDLKVTELAGPVIDGGNIFVFGRLDPNAGLGLGCGAFCAPLDGGPVRMFGTFDELPFHARKIACAGGGHYCVSAQNGIIAVPLDGGPLRRIDEAGGLPSKFVRAMAWLDGKVYAALQDGYLVRWDPRSGVCEVLASSRSKEKHSTFDDCPPYEISFLTSDPPRHRLLLLVRFAVGDNDHMNDQGLWQFDPVGGFKKLMQVDESAIHTCSGVPARSDELLLWFYVAWLVRVDLKTDTPSVVHGPSITSPIPSLRQHHASYRNFAGTGPPYAEANGWLWAVQTMFARMSKDKGTIERLPALDTGKPGAHYRFLEAVGDGSRLIVGDDSAFWLLTLKDNPKP